MIWGVDVGGRATRRPELVSGHGVDLRDECSLHLTQASAQATAYGSNRLEDTTLQNIIPDLGRIGTTHAHLCTVAQRGQVAPFAIAEEVYEG